MCGIVGYFGVGHDVDESSFLKSLDLIKHRGPDATGFKRLGEFGALGHTRLAIIGLENKSNQPMCNEDYTLAYNGEIYNHKELRTLITSKFETSCDTETLLLGLSQFGTKFLNQCDGMFAGGLFSKESATLSLFRDSFGIKNLYVFTSGDCVYFSSEIKSLLEIIPSRPGVNKKSLKSYLSFENFGQSESIFEGIRSLEPGELMTLKVEGESLKVESSPAITKQSISGKGFSEKTEISVLGEVRKAVKEHLISDVPVGVYMSGGIDSSLVSTLAAKEISGIEGYIGYFEGVGEHYDERPHARLVAQRAGIKLNEIKITAEDFIDNFDKVIYALDEPRMGMGSFSQYMVAKAASGKHKVLLAGHGGDELFAGYPMFKAFYILDSLIKGRLYEAGRLLINGGRKNLAWFLYASLRKLITNRFSFAPEIFNTGVLRDLFSTRKKGQIVDDLFKYYEEVYLPGLLIVEDKISMANSIETRVPLWSNRCWRLAKRYTSGEKLTNGTLKYVLKEASSSILPHEVIYGKKKGFPTPLRIWFRSSLKDFIYERLLEPNSFLDNVISLSERKRILFSHQYFPLPFAFDEKRAHKIWIMLCLESWGRQFCIK